jgi:serine protease Do
MKRSLLLLFLAVPVAGQDDFRALEGAIRGAVQRVAPSIVTIETFGGARQATGRSTTPPADAPLPESRPESRPQPDSQPQNPLRPQGFLAAQGASTGIVLSADGWIVVSRFALGFEPSTILVTLADGRTLPARRAGEDKSRGIALLKVETTGLPVPEHVAPANVRVGQWAIACGRTFGRRDPSVHFGIVSARGRIFGRALQIDANTSPANYGGPVLDLEGRVLGITVPLSLTGRDAGVDLYDSGIGFAATLADIGPLLERMKRGESLDRGWLGVSTDPAFAGPGAKVQAVVPGSPAAASGLKKDDLITAIDGTPVKHGFHLQMLVSSRMAGDALGLSWRRGEQESALPVTLAGLPEAERKAKKKEEDAGQLPWEEEGGKK